MWLIIVGFIVVFSGFFMVVIVKNKFKNDEEKALTRIGIIIGIIGASLTFLGFFQNLPKKGTTSETNNNVKIAPNIPTQQGLLDSIKQLQTSSDSTEQLLTKSTDRIEETISPSNNQQNRVVIESIYGVNDIIIANLRIKEYFNGKVNVSISKDDICEVNNRSEFPQKLWGNQPTFCVKLKRNPFRMSGDNKSRFVVDINNEYSGSYSEVKEIDISMYINNH